MIGLLKWIAKAIAYTVAYFVVLGIIGVFIDVSDQNEQARTAMLGRVIDFSVLFMIGWFIFLMVKKARNNHVSKPEPAIVEEINIENSHILIEIGITHSSNRRYKINYTDGEGNKSERIISPIKIMREPSGEFYIDAHCELRNDMRTFRSSRIEPPIVDVETGEVVYFENFPYTQIFEGARGGQYIIKNGKKRYL